MTRLRIALLVIVFAVAAPLAAHAVQPDEMLADPKLEHRAREISGGVRCMVCQNENIDDSNAPLARDLRLLVRERLKKGDSDDQVRDYLVARYGDFVLLKPPLKASTLILWITPALVLLAAAGFTIARLRGRKTAPVAALSDAERAELARLAADDSAASPITKA
ncbi:MAG TPA: cytochrome c-type biogenesis protein CcmH [Rhodoblastus sp.]|nr:cytochrome c-type biogenesis protein CcmH [Rhodoblastus sp.]